MITRRDVATGLAGFILHAGADPWSSALAAVPSGKADRIVVAKADRRLFLLRDGEILRSYRVALGWQPAKVLHSD